MHDDWLKRGIHFAVGFVAGGSVCALLAIEVVDTLLEAGGAVDAYAKPTWALIEGLAGGLVVGLLSAWRLDRFWD